MSTADWEAIIWRLPELVYVKSLDLEDVNSAWYLVVLLVPCE